MKLNSRGRQKIRGKKSNSNAIMDDVNSNLINIKCFLREKKLETNISA